MNHLLWPVAGNQYFFNTIPVSAEDIQQKIVSAGSDKAKNPFVDSIAEAFAKISAASGKELEELNTTQARRQAAIGDLFRIKSALSDYRAAHPGNNWIDLSNVMVTPSRDSPLRDGSRQVALTDMMDYYRRENPEIELPRFPQTSIELDAYLTRIDTALKMVLEPASQAAYTKLERLTQKQRAMEQFEATLYQIIFDASKKAVSGC
jgi:hypothetical protein